MFNNTANNYSSIQIYKTIHIFWSLQLSFTNVSQLTFHNMIVTIASGYYKNKIGRENKYNTWTLSSITI